MIRGFLRDRTGSYAIAVAIGLVPLIGGVALAIDYGELSRQRHATINALDAAGIAAARHIAAGKSQEEVLRYTQDFFHANLGRIDPASTRLHIALPDQDAGGGTLRLSAELVYSPYFLPAFHTLIHKPGGDAISHRATTEIRLKNTLEVALVLDNSGSMDFLGFGSSQKRMALLKDAAKQLVATLARQAEQMKQIDRPVQFAVVPFAASVNVGSHHDAAAWMDTQGLSPVHHENLDWTTLTDPAKTAHRIGGVWRKAGGGWGDEQGEALTRFTLFDTLTHEVANKTCTGSGKNQKCTITYTHGSYAGWSGCVEARPHPHNVTDTEPAAADPATLFVPMFAPDEPGDRWATDADPNPVAGNAANNWWNDFTTGNAGGQTKLRNAAKYFEVRPYGASSPKGAGPNYSCTTTPITPLTDVGTEEGLATVTAAIDAMQSNGATNVPEGLAWGWRALSSGEPFTGGRPETERGNDKVVIVLTDGENTYYVPSSLGHSDPAGSKSTYSAHGYLQPGYNGTGIGRLLDGTALNGVYTNANYTRAMNAHMAALCDNAKQAGVIVMTVALDLDASNSGQAATIEAMRECASDSRFRKNPSDASKAAKLFWNATGATLSDNFKEIADELSNLRIVG